jgi:hypothetical protein
MLGPVPYFVKIIHGFMDMDKTVAPGSPKGSAS